MKRNNLYLSEVNKKRAETYNESLRGKDNDLNLTPVEFRQYNELQQRMELHSIEVNKNADLKTRNKLAMAVKELIEFEERHEIAI